MRRAICLLATSVAICLASQVASAQVTGLVTDRELYNLSGLVNDGRNGPQPVSVQNVPIVDGSVQNNFSTRLADSGTPGGPPIYSVTNYQVATDVDNVAGYISFAANATVAGLYAQSTVGTTLDVTYTNSGSTSLPVTLTSSIIPSGFGAYVSDPLGNVMGGDINHNPEAGVRTFLDVARSAPFSTGSTGPIATSQVMFQILSGSTVVANYDAGLQIFATSDGAGGYRSATPVLTNTGWILDASGNRQPLTLNNFGLIDADDPNKAVGYRWDATDVTVPLGIIGAGESKTLTYVTRVESDVASTGLGYAMGQLLAYAGFGDPIGEHAGAGGIADPGFSLLELSTPTLSQSATGLTISAGKFLGYADGPLALRQIDGLGGLASAVPEPASWVMMMGGVGLIGGAMRRRPRRLRLA